MVEDAAHIVPRKRHKPNSWQVVPAATAQHLAIGTEAAYRLSKQCAQPVTDNTINHVRIKRAEQVPNGRQGRKVGTAEAERPP